MIQINLLPQNFSGKKAKAPRAASKSAGASLGASPRSGGGAGGLLLTVVILLVVLVNGGLVWAAYQKVHQAKTAYEAVQAQCQAVEREVAKKKDTAASFERFHEVLANQMDVLRTLDPPDRILWSLKLNMLSNLMPANVFVSDININEIVAMVETEQSKSARKKWSEADAKKRGKEPAEVKKPIIHYEMRLTGLALGADNVEQFNNMLKLHEAMTTYSMPDASGTPLRFMEGFTPNIEFESVVAKIYEGEPVNQFVMKLTTRDMGGEQPTAPKTVKKPQEKRVAAN